MALRAATEVSLEVLSRIGARTGFANQEIDVSFKRHRNLDPRDKALISEIVYGTLRMRLRLDYIIAKFSSIPPAKMERKVLETIRVALYQALLLDRIPQAAAVSGSVEAAPVRSKAFVNGLLRTILREWKDSDLKVLRTEPVRYLEIVHSHPRWLVERWIETYGFDFAEKLCRGNNVPPSLHLRVNTKLHSRNDLVSRLVDAGFAAHPSQYIPEGIRVEKAGDPAALPGFKEGWFVVQDEASQAVSHLVDPKPGVRILDACAAPGGKSTHMAQLSGDRAEIVALDPDPRRLTLLSENCIRLRLSSIRIVRGDAASPDLARNLGVFDRILVDAPCSALGLLHKNPEIRWRRGGQDLGRLADTQSAILGNAAELLKMNGLLVYSTCTVTREENEQVVDRFLADRPGFKRVDVRPFMAGRMAELADEAGFMRTFYAMHGTDGFFAARFVKHED